MSERSAPSRDPFAALGNATAATIVDTAPQPPRIKFPWVTSIIAAVCFVLSVMAMAAKDIVPATALLSLSLALGVAAIATSLLRRLELRLIDVERAIHDRRA